MTIRSAIAELWRPPAPVVAEKAATGIGVAMMTYNAPLADMSKGPQKRMREAQAIYWSNFAIRSAESVVTRKSVNLPWHLETENDDEIEAGPIFELINRPQAMIPGLGRRMTRRALWSITYRHMGLCNVGYWFADQEDLNGAPLGFLYVNPARVWPVSAKSGNLIGWVIDAQGINYDGQPYGGLPLRVEELIPFTLNEPDMGHTGHGLVEAVWDKVQVLGLADRHYADVLSSGGRMAGLVSPKEGVIPSEAFKNLERAFRNAAEDPQAAKRTIISEGPLDFQETGATPNELNEIDISRASRDDIFTVWGVPGSQAPVATAGGLNSGETKGYDEAVLMQGAVHDRVQAFSETLQSIIDRFGAGVSIEIEEPSFDDESPAYEIASKARDLPLTRNQRLELIGKDPLPEYGPDGQPLGLAIDLPIGLTVVGQGPEESGGFDNAPEPEPSPADLMLAAGTIPAAPGGPPASGSAALSPATKASLKRPIEALRRQIDDRYVPSVHMAMAALLMEQRQEIVRKIIERADHLRRSPGDEAAWWSEQKWNRRMTQVLAPLYGKIATAVTTKVDAVFTGKAATFTDAVTTRVMRTAAQRVKRINDTTRDQVREAVRRGIAENLTAQEIAALVEDLTGFDPARAELIARTETMYAYNASALESYGELGVTMVEPIDGDEDEECQARLARGMVTIEEALADEDHPNGTLDWVPVLDEPPAKAEPLVKVAVEQPTDPAYLAFKELMSGLANREPAVLTMPAPNVTVEAPPAPVVYMDTSQFAAALQELKVALTPAPRNLEVVRDENGKIIGARQV